MRWWGGQPFLLKINEKESISLLHWINKSSTVALGCVGQHALTPSMLNHVNDTSRSAGAGNGSVTAAAYEMSVWGESVTRRRGLPGKGWKPRRSRRESLESPANERLPVYSQAGMYCLRARQRQSQAGVPCPP